MYLIGYSLDLAVRRGMDYEDPARLNAVIRLSRFTGCTGAISFDSGSNNRSFTGFDITQYEYDSDLEQFYYQ
jgi:hypothetical protein